MASCGCVGLIAGRGFALGKTGVSAFGQGSNLGGRVEVIKLPVSI